MEKNELKERLDTLVGQIKTNSKDAHFAEKLIDELLLTKGQLSREPVEFDCGTKIDEYAGNAFHIVRTSRGILYHEYGGYNVFIEANGTALFDALNYIIDNQKDFESEDETVRETFNAFVLTVGYCMSVPKIALADADFTNEVVCMVIDYMKKKLEEATKAPLQEETIEEDRAFKEAAVALEELKKETENGDEN